MRREGEECGEKCEEERRGGVWGGGKGRSVKRREWEEGREGVWGGGKGRSTGSMASEQSGQGSRQKHKHNGMQAQSRREGHSSYC